MLNKLTYTHVCFYPELTTHFLFVALTVRIKDLSDLSLAFTFFVDMETMPDSWLAQSTQEWQILVVVNCIFNKRQYINNGRETICILYPAWWDSNIPYLQICIYKCKRYLAICLTIIPAFLLSLEKDQDAGCISEALLSRKWSFPVFQQVTRSGTHHRPEGPQQGSRCVPGSLFSFLVKMACHEQWTRGQPILHTKHKSSLFSQQEKKCVGAFLSEILLSPYHKLGSGWFGEMLEALWKEEALGQLAGHP